MKKKSKNIILGFTTEPATFLSTIVFWYKSNKRVLLRRVFTLTILENYPAYKYNI